jgi:hypothetical protein
MVGRDQIGPGRKILRSNGLKGKQHRQSYHRQPGAAPIHHSSELHAITQLPTASTIASPGRIQRFGEDDQGLRLHANWAVARAVNVGNKFFL